jgi:riboflavin synthase
LVLDDFSHLFYVIYHLHFWDFPTMIFLMIFLRCSICVSGVCLTATALDPVQRTFTVGLAPETLRKTYFSSLQPGQAVNLERASEIGGRNSGHFVQGHVDGTGTIIRKQPDQDSLAITIQLDNPDLIKCIVPKGFIAIDGTSLTVVDVDPIDKTFSFMLIEYTQKKIIIPQKQIGDKVNLEVDVLGKYSETALAALMPRLEALEAKVESLERALLSGSPSLSSQQQQQQYTPSPSDEYDSYPMHGSMVPRKTYQPPPKSTAVRPMGGVPKSTASYLKDEAEAFRRLGSPMARPVSRERRDGDQEVASSGVPNGQSAVAASPDSSYLDQLESGFGEKTPAQSQQRQNLPPPQRRQSISLNPEPQTASSSSSQRGRFISVPTGKGIPNTAHSQESLPDPLL